MKDIRPGAYLFAIILTIVLIIAVKLAIHFNTRSVISNVKITGKERITVGSGEHARSKYLIFTDGETFENTDSFLAMKFGSSDIYGKFKEGQICTLTVVGFRVQLVSWYRNILEANCQ